MVYSQTFCQMTVCWQTSLCQTIVLLNDCLLVNLVSNDCLIVNLESSDCLFANLVSNDGLLATFCQRTISTHILCQTTIRSETVCQMTFYLQTLISSIKGLSVFKPCVKKSINTKGLLICKLCGRKFLYI